MKITQVYRFTTIFFVNLLVLFLLLELTSIAFIYLTENKFFYSAIHKKTETTLGIENQAEKDAHVFMQLHPYLGFTPRNANNLGFDSDVDYPYEKKREEYLIGIFGGSVANLFNDYEERNHTLEQTLQEYLSKHYGRNIKIKFLNLALAVYKQPQQLFALNYALALGQHFDAVINIDGFNEVLGAAKNLEYGIEPSAPSVIITAGLTSLANKDYSTDLELTLAIVDSKKKWRASQTEASECRLASCYTYMQAKKNYYMKTYSDYINKKIGNHESHQSNELSLVYIGKLKNSTDKTMKENQIVSIWENSFLTMRQILQARGIPFFSFIQPNQYHQTARVMSTEEKAIAILDNENSEFQTYIPSGYARMVAEASRLREQGIQIYDATQIFDSYPQTVYVDNCCHYNDTGNQIFAEYIGKTMISEFQINALKSEKNTGMSNDLQP